MDLGAFFIIYLLVILIAGIFWIWMIIDCATSKNLKGTDKVVWIVIILSTSVLGAGLYFCLARRTAVTDGSD